MAKRGRRKAITCIPAQFNKILGYLEKEDENAKIACGITDETIRSINFASTEISFPCQGCTTDFNDLRPSWNFQGFTELLRIHGSVMKSWNFLGFLDNHRTITDSQIQGMSKSSINSEMTVVFLTKYR